MAPRTAAATFAAAADISIVSAGNPVATLDANPANALAAPAPGANQPALAANGAAPAPGAVPATAQVSAAMVTLTRHDGAQTLQIRLRPDELGGLTIRVARPTDGPPSVTLTADRADTLAMLARDQAQLHRALDQAGVPAEGRTLSFHLAARDGAEPPSGATSQNNLMEGGGSASRDTSSFTGGQSRDRPAASDDRLPVEAPRGLPDSASPPATAAPIAGIDITA